MAKLIAFLFTTLPAFFTLLLASFGRKYTTAVAGLLSLSLMLVLFIASINTILQSVLSYLALPSWLAVSVGMFIPSNFSVILSAMVSAKIARAAYDYGRHKTDLVVKAT